MADLKKENIEQILFENPNLEKINDGEKLKCSLSGHEMPCRLDVLQSYISGKKYKRLKAKHDQESEKYMQHLEPSKGRGNQHGHSLYCKLTCRYLSNQPQHISRHVEGKRFKKVLLRWEECQKTGKEFVPRQQMNKDKVAMETDDGMAQSESSSESHGEEGDDDDVPHDDEMAEDMDDLYPPSDFVGSSGDDEERGEGEEMEADGVSSDASDYDFDDIHQNISAGQAEGRDTETISGKQPQIKRKRQQPAQNSKKLKGTDNNSHRHLNNKATKNKT